MKNGCAITHCNQKYTIPFSSTTIFCFSEFYQRGGRTCFHKIIQGPSQGHSWKRDKAKHTGVSISSIVERQANFNKEPGLLSLNVWVNACKGSKFQVKLATLKPLLGK